MDLALAGHHVPSPNPYMVLEYGRFAGLVVMSVTEQQGLNVSKVTQGKLTWNLDDVLSRVQRPKIDEYGDHLSIVVHFPVFDKNIRITDQVKWISSLARTTWSPFTQAPT